MPPATLLAAGLVLAVASVLAGAIPAATAATRSGPADPGQTAGEFPLLPPYPGAQPVRTAEPTPPRTHTLTLGAPKRAGRERQAAASRRISGSLAQHTYRIPDGRSTEEILAHYRAAARRSGGQTLFLCQGRACGSSNYWANQVFGIATLYGPEDDQAVLVTRLPQPPDHVYATIYIIVRGNRRVYAHHDLLSSSTAVTAADPATLFRQLAEERRLALTDLPFDAEDKLPDTAPLAPLAEALQRDQSVNIYLVGHLHGGQIDTSLARAKQRADAVRAALIQLGIRADRLAAYGVGSLAPAANLPGDRMEIVLAE